VVKANVHLRDLSDIPRLDRVWREFFPKDPPARTIFPVNGLGAKQSLLEITVVAVTDDGATRKEVIKGDIRPPIFHESPAVRAGDLLFISGLMAANQGGLVANARPNPNLPYDRDSAAAQMEDILTQAETLCSAAGADLRNCLRMLNVHTDLTEHARSRAVQERFFTRGLPASSTVGVTKELQVPMCTVMADFWVAMTD
jgi:enamine deaminase RidA (YjgF/YER057c/UK114 family)